MSFLLALEVLNGGEKWVRGWAILESVRMLVPCLRQVQIRHSQDLPLSFIGLGDFRVNPRFHPTSVGWNLGLTSKSPIVISDINMSITFTEGSECKRRFIRSRATFLDGLLWLAHHLYQHSSNVASCKFAWTRVLRLFDSQQYYLMVLITWLSQDPDLTCHFTWTST